MWGNLSDSAREQFYWDDPGSPFLPSSSSSKTTTMTTTPPRGGRDVESGRVLPPPDNFLLMLLYPFRVDYLRLTDNYHRVDEWDRKGRNGRRGILRREGDDNDDDNGDGDGSMCRWESMRVNP